MATREELLAEAYRRGLMPPQQRAAYEEAQRRGIVKGAPAPAQNGPAGFVDAFWKRAGQDLPKMLPGPLGTVAGAAAMAFPRQSAGMVQRAVQPITLNAADEIVSSVPAVAAARRGESPRQAFTQAQGAQKTKRENFARTNPNLARTADVVGGAASMAIPIPAVGAANTLKGAVSSGAMLGGAQGFLQGFLGADEGQRLEQGAAGGLTGAAIGGAFPFALSAAGNVAQRLRQPAGIAPIDPNVQLLANEGVTLTPGQMRGGVPRSAEEAATSLPFVGNAISDRRREGIETFNRAVANRVLAPVGEKLPDNVRPGSEAVKYAGDLISKGYEDAIPGRAVRLDPAFAEDVAGAFDATIDMTAGGRERLDDIIFQRITSRLPENGVIDGRRYKIIQSDLDRSVERFSKSLDSDDQAMAEALKGIQSALEGAAKRQDPDFADKIQALDRSWAELSRMEVAAGKDNQLEGVFTPAQYGQAIRAADSRVRKRGVARGEALSQDLAQAALKVLPSKTPNSGTMDRAGWGLAASVPGSILGAVTGGPVLGPLVGIGGTAATLGAASRLYTPEAVEAANAALRQRMVRQSGIMERLGGELPPLTPFLPGMGAPNPFAFMAPRAAPPTAPRR
jgi:hypothetical protein